MYMYIRILKDKNKIRKHVYKYKKWRIKDKKILSIQNICTRILLQIHKFKSRRTWRYKVLETKLEWKNLEIQITFKEKM